ncbi:hypothetical protein [Micromonospora sp. NPDC049240]|uniref:hypothetical protein n=1 Tax=Micromonospora sp. NPDC049240 TaxID=3155151 RepID=UPI0033EA7F36
MSIMRALMTGDPAERDRIVNRETLRYAVSRAITCRASGRILDVRTAVYAAIKHGGETSAVVIDGEVWDRIRADLEVLALSKGAELEIIDGRKL